VRDVSQPDRSDNDEVEETVKRVRGKKRKLVAIYDNQKSNEKIEIVTEVMFSVMTKEQKGLDAKAKKVPVQMSCEKINSEKNLLASPNKANAPIRDNSCIRYTYFVVLRSRVNRSGNISARSVVGHKPVNEGVNEEKLNVSNYSNKSHLESSDRAKLAGNRIAFVRHNSYI
jgi:hypothetical protein